MNTVTNMMYNACMNLLREENAARTGTGMPAVELRFELTDEEATQWLRKIEQGMALSVRYTNMPGETHMTPCLYC